MNPDNSTDSPRLMRRGFTILAAAVLAWSPAQAVRAELLFALTHDNATISAHDADTGAILWDFPTPTTPQSGGGNGLAYSGSQLFMATIQEPIIYVIDPTTGDLIDQFNLANPQPTTVLAPIDALGYGHTSFGPTLFALNYTANNIHLLSPENGAVFDSYQLSGFDPVGGIDFNHVTSKLYVTDGAGNVSIVDPETGALEETLAIGGGFRTGLGLVGDRLFLSNQSTNLIEEFDPSSGLTAINSFVTASGPASALAGGPPVPEPATIALAACVAAAATGCRLARRRPGFLTADRWTRPWGTRYAR